LPIDITTLDGHESIIPYEPTWLALDTLAAYDDQLQPRPMLAESWDISSDFRQIKLNLRRGVQYHTGREFTSDDVQYNLVRAQDPKRGGLQLGPRAQWFSPQVDLPDKYTAVLTSDVPRPLMFDLFEYFNMVDKDTVEGPDAKTKLVGTGPFQFIEWVQGDHITLKKNPNYWQSGRPYLDGIAFSIAKDPQAMVAQLEAGRFDIAWRPSLTDLQRLGQDPKYQSLTHPNSGYVWTIGTNLRNPPLDNKTVRQAMNFAIDRQRISDTVTHGAYPPVSLPWGPGTPGYEAAKEHFYTFDLEKARGLLDQAGVSAASFDFVVQNSGTAEFSQVAEIYQADLAKLGIQLNIKVLDSNVYLDQVNNGKNNGISMGTSSYAQLEPATMFTTGRGLDPKSNNSGFSSDRYTQLVGSANTETDPAKRKQLYSMLNDILLDESFVMFVAKAPPSILTSARVHGIGHTLHASFTYTDAWLDA
jgi:peptide/nickel transport system substrate-binding protein